MIDPAERFIDLDDPDRQWKSVYALGGATAAIVLAGIAVDIIAGISTGADLTAIPETAIERFEQLRDNRWLGLYNLDLLNLVSQILLIPTYFALYAAHRRVFQPYAALAFIIFIAGTIVFMTNNAALRMLELSEIYAATSDEEQKAIIAAAGEAILAAGAHGGLGAFIGFALPATAGILMSWTMVKGRVFSRTTAYSGLAGAALMLVYVVVVTFIPSAAPFAMALAMPGGVLIMAWMILFTVKLFKLGMQKI